MSWSSTLEGTGSPIVSGAPACAFGTFRSLSTISLIMKLCSAVRLMMREGGAITGLVFDCASTTDGGANSAMAATVETVTSSLCMHAYRTFTAGKGGIGRPSQPGAGGLVAAAASVFERAPNTA